MSCEFEICHPGKVVEMAVSSMKFVRGRDGVGIEDIFFDEDDRLHIILTNGDIYVSESLRGHVTEEDIQQVVSEVLDIIHIPVNISELVNDLHYATENWVESKGYLTSYTETDPTVPTWAKQPNKPSYTANEVGAVSTEIFNAEVERATQAEDALNNELATKQDIISDLSAIRAGAAAGSTALQPGDVPEWAMSENKPIYTASEVGAVDTATFNTEVERATNVEGELRNEIAQKQEIISDLDDIRSGASAGATALQPNDIADWAKQPNKPVYTATEVGAYTTTETDDKLHELNQWAVNEFSNVDESLAGKEATANKAEMISGANIDTTHYPSVKAITDWVSDRLPSADEKSYWNAKADISDIEEAEATLHGEIQLVKGKIPTKLNQLADDSTHRTVTDEQIESWSHASVDTDDVTITKTSDNKLQAVAINLVSGGYQDYWVGTKAEYNAIAEKNPNTFYEVLDDEESALFEVDGTTIEFTDDKILQIPNNIDLMYQTMMYGGGESGYRKYRNGCLEQWGVATSSANGEAELSMHQPHIDTNFSIFVTPRERGNFFWYALPTAQQRFAVRIQSRDSQSMAVLFQWRSWGRWK